MHRIILANLMIFAALNLAFLFPRASETKDETGSTLITWHPDEQLSWLDFRGKARSHSGVSALTASAIEYSYDCDRSNVELRVRAVFLPYESWVKSDAKTRYILSHEQLHFDITEVYARKLRNELSLKVRSCDDVHKIDRIARRVIGEWSVAQRRYDEETRHSINRDSQAEWERKVAKDLEAYSDHSYQSWRSND